MSFLSLYIGHNIKSAVLSRCAARSLSRCAPNASAGIAKRKQFERTFYICIYVYVYVYVYAYGDWISHLPCCQVLYGSLHGLNPNFQRLHAMMVHSSISFEKQTKRNSLDLSSFEPHYDPMLNIESFVHDSRCQARSTSHETDSGAIGEYIGRNTKLCCTSGGPGQGKECGPGTPLGH